ncbi:MAG: hypothetical protein CFE31_08410 [Rhizobiales bacterium PAR1]|nr:MAG: hypothetical protein CFE31_08410 [Rhizobiales bacterium PAR1]
MTKSITLIGAYVLLLLASTSAALTQDASPAIQSHEAGRQAYEAACLSCHYNGAKKVDFGSRSPAGKGSADELVSKILFGVPAEDDVPGLRMPGFRTGLTDAEIAGIAAYLRASRTKSPPLGQYRKARGQHPRTWSKR